MKKEIEKNEEINFEIRGSERNINERLIISTEKYEVMYVR